MSLETGSRVGPYEILGSLGAGGMGEVYRARDERLKRDVAIKVLPASYSQDADRLRRFEREAQAAGGLNHPNITAVYDIGTHNGAPYVVSELLEGEALASALAGGRLSQRKAIDYALQIAHGLSAAHEKGIVHRDLKPDNLFVTKDGRVKILDFGLAKLIHAEEGSQFTDLSTATAGTEPGVVLGTLGYMSPEQVRGKPADARSDIFSFGAILYEMLSGKRAFRGDSAADTMSAILREDPPEISVTNRNVSLALDRIIRHCLEKNPEQRFHSVHDVAFDLEAVSGISPESPKSLKPTRRRAIRFGSLLTAIAAVAALAALAGHYVWRTPPVQPRFHRLTFRRGDVRSARFTPEGRTVVFSSTWEGNPIELYSTRLDSPESRPLGFSDTALLSVSSAGELAMLIHPRSALWGGGGGLGGYGGTLALASLAGGAAHEVLEDVLLADWTPDGKALAVVRSVGGLNRLELPVGHRLYETPDNVLAMRVSPRGDLVALAEHPQGFGTNGSVSLVDLNGKKRTLTDGEVGNFADLAWTPSGREVWFEFGTHAGDSLKAVDLAKRRRSVLKALGRVRLLDISGDLRALIARVNWRVGILGALPGQREERDFSWLDASEVDDVSPDGSQLLITEFGEGGDTQRWSVYLRRTDGSPAVRLGDGQAMTFSPDGKWALAMLRTEPPQLAMFPTGPGEAVRIPNHGISDYFMAAWLADGKHILFTGVQTGHGPRCYVQGIGGENLRAVTPEGVTLPVAQSTLSQDRRTFVAIGPDHLGRLYTVDGEGPRPIPGMRPWEKPLRWSADGRALYVARLQQPALRVDRLDLSTGARTLWKEITPSDPAGLNTLYAIQISPEQGWYFYSYSRVLSDLYVVDGLR